MPIQKIYCNSCGEKVEPLIALNTKGEEKNFCINCGLPLEDTPPEETYQLEHVVIAEDSALIQQIISDVLVGQGFARMLSTCVSGEEMIARLTNLFAHDRTPDLIILDVNMSGMSGIDCAVSIRALEQGMSTKEPIPILFFTSEECDAKFKNTLRSLSPAMYVNKGLDSSPQLLGNRFQTVITKLLELRNKMINSKK
jgi:CheY-like chemotaxis protein